MGKRGSEVSREAADLILLDDNFTTIVETIKDGRRIFDNIRKAVGYVFTVHIPIALAALCAPALGIGPEHLLFLPMLVVLLELIIDPTCSIVLERQPAESDIMERGPRDPKRGMLTFGVMLKSISQGLTIFAASFCSYYYTLSKYPDNAGAARSMGIGVIMVANLFLVWCNSSDIDGIFTSIVRLSKDGVMWIVNTAVMAALLVFFYTPLGAFLKLAPLSAGQFAAMFALAAASVLWYEIVKLVKRIRR
jgi:Ca2+-transporting ATPase